MVTFWGWTIPLNWLITNAWYGQFFELRVYPPINKTKYVFFLTSTYYRDHYSDCLSYRAFNTCHSLISIYPILTRVDMQRRKRFYLNNRNWRTCVLHSQAGESKHSSACLLSYRVMSCGIKFPWSVTIKELDVRWKHTITVRAKKSKKSIYWN